MNKALQPRLLGTPIVTLPSLTKLSHSIPFSNLKKSAVAGLREAHLDIFPRDDEIVSLDNACVIGTID